MRKCRVRLVLEVASVNFDSTRREPPDKLCWENAKPTLSPDLKLGQRKMEKVIHSSKLFLRKLEVAIVGYDLDPVARFEFANEQLGRQRVEQ